MVIYENPKYIQVVHHPDKNYILFDWSDFLIPLPEIKDLHQKALTVALDKKCMYYVAESSKVGNMLRPEVIKWWADEWVPQLNDKGLRAIVTVVPSVGLAAMSTHSWQAQVIGNITMMNARSLAEAETILKDLQKNTSPVAAPAK